MKDKIGEPRRNEIIIFFRIKPRTVTLRTVYLEATATLKISNFKIEISNCLKPAM